MRAALEHRNNDQANDRCVAHHRSPNPIGGRVWYCCSSGGARRAGRAVAARRRWNTAGGISGRPIAAVTRDPASPAARPRLVRDSLAAVLQVRVETRCATVGWSMRTAWRSAVSDLTLAAGCGSLTQTDTASQRFGSTRREPRRHAAMRDLLHLVQIAVQGGNLRIRQLRQVSASHAPMVSSVRPPSATPARNSWANASAG
jgi:hypothetical protein